MTSRMHASLMDKLVLDDDCDSTTEPFTTHVMRCLGAYACTRALLGSHVPDVPNDEAERAVFVRALVAQNPRAFVRACFETKGLAYLNEDSVAVVTLDAIELAVAEAVVEATPVTWSAAAASSDARLVGMSAVGANAVELCDWMYDGCPDSPDQFCPHKRNLCEFLVYGSNAKPAFRFVRTIAGAPPPTKAHVTDTGFDLWLISEIDPPSDAPSGLKMYDTGIAVQPPHGYYFEIVGRSSIVKTGHMLANCTGIIDAGYQGSLKVPLVKVDPTAPDLRLPVKLVQLIPRRLHHMDAVETASFSAPTARGAGGFGSSDAAKQGGCIEA